MDLDALREALEWHEKTGFPDGLPQPFILAARAVLDSDEVDWCPFHKAAGEPNTDCWGAGLDGQDACSMVRRRLLAEDR